MRAKVAVYSMDLLIDENPMQVRRYFNIGRFNRQNEWIFKTEMISEPVLVKEACTSVLN